MESSESLTKFLRNRNTSVEEVCKVSQKLLDENDDLMLPNATRFILELISDRLSQNNAFTLNFKLNEQFWCLFYYLWIGCNKDAQLLSMRSKVLSKLKFGEIFSNLISEIDDKDLTKNESYLDSLFTMMNLVIENGRLVFSQDQNLNFLKELTKSIVSNDYGANLKLKIIQIIYKVFKLNNSNTSKYDTKHVKEFCTFVLPNLLVIIRKNADSSALQKDIESLIVQTLFREDTVQHISDNIEFFLNAPLCENLTVFEFTYLIKLIIPNVKIDALEEVYKSIIESYPMHSAVLLKEVTSMNKTLSTTFLSSLVERQIGSPNPDLNVISQAIKRNSEVGLKFQTEIIELCLKDSHTKELTERFFDCYVNAREVPAFVKLWNEFIIGNESCVFASDNFIEYTSSKLVSLSFFQLSAVVEQCVTSYQRNVEDLPVAILSICKGLLRGLSGCAPNSISKTLIENLSQLKPSLISLLKIKGKHFFKVSSHILSLFDLEALQEDIDVKQLFLKPIENEDHYYYAFFRIIEQDVNLCKEKPLKKFIKYFSKASDSFKLRIFNRWFVLIDIIFKQEDIDGLIASLFETKSIAKKEIVALLKHPLMSDQSKIMFSIINYISTHAKFVSVLNIVSVSVYTKKQKQDVLDMLLENTLARRITIDEFVTLSSKLLTSPTFKSQLESNFDSLIELLQLNDKNSSIFSIIELVVSINAKRSDKLSGYFQGAFDKIEESLKTNTNQLVFIELSRVLVNETCLYETMENSRKSLLDLLTTKSIKLLNKSTSEEEICLLLSNLASTVQLHSVNEKQLKSTIDELGRKYKSSAKIQSELFHLISSLKGYEPTYVLGLYVALNNKENVKPINKLIGSLSADVEQYLSLWKNIIHSLHVDIPSSHNSYIEVISCFIKSCPRPQNNELVSCFHKLLVTSVSEIFTLSLQSNSDVNIDALLRLLESLKVVATSKSWILTQYATEMILVFISDLCRYLKTSHDLTSEIYVEVTKTVSVLILYQRYRFKKRHHLIVLVFVTLMNLLVSRSKDLSSECGLSFERLMSNLCEPSGNLISSANLDETVSRDIAVSNALAQLKSNLRKNLHVILFNYIKFYLQYQIELKIKSHLDTSIYMVMDLFTTTELHLINKALDNQGRVVFKTIYEDYQKYFKWKEE